MSFKAFDNVFKCIEARDAHLESFAMSRLHYIFVEGLFCVKALLEFWF